MKKNILVLVVSFVLLSSCVVFATGTNGGMNVSLGYTIIDDYDNPSVSQETYNYYEGFALSIDNFRYSLNNGINFNGNFYNTTLNNRNIRFSSFKSGLYNLSLYNNQYRRIYDATGSKFTRRESSGIKGFVQPTKNIKFFGGFNYSDKDGLTSYTFRPILEVQDRSVNFTTYNYNFGGTVFDKHGNVTVDYKTFIAQDDEIPGFMHDRKATQLNITASSTVPNHEEIQLFAGYLSREDKMDSLTTNLKTTNGWGAVRYYFGDQFRFNYRLIMTSTEHFDNATTTDNNYHTASIQKDWDRIGGIRVGYEMRKSEDDINKASSNGYIIDGWYNYNQTWFFRGRYSSHTREVDEGSVLIGDREKSKHLFSVKYMLKDFGSMTGKVERQIKRYNDIADLGDGLVSSEANYTKASFRLSLKDKRFGKLIFTNSYYLGKYEDLSNETSYEFSDHILTATVIPREIGQFELLAGSSYYRSRRNVDAEKFNFTGSITWNFMSDHKIVAGYQVYTFDDLLVSPDTYTTNIVEIKFIKNLTF